MKSITVPQILRKNYFWQSVLGFMFLVLIVYFIRNESVELGKIRPILSGANIYYIIAGILISFLYIFFQAYLYVWSFKSVNKKLPLIAAAQLFLKRNLVGVLVPGGTFSSLAFFNADLEKYKISKTQQYTGSYIFGLASTVSIIVVAIPAFVLMTMRRQLNSLELAGFIFLVVVIVFLAWGFYTLVSKEQGFLYKIISKYKPEWLITLEDFSKQHISLKKIVLTCLVSVGIELIGVLHLYIALLALNATAMFSVALTGYVVMVIVMTFSPFMKGLGAIEISLTYLLVQYGYETSVAASITLLFRFFEFWLPLLIGLFVFIIRKESILLRLIPAMLLLVSGLISVVSVLTPALPSRLTLINDILPLSFIQFSNFSVLLFGIVLIVLSGYLFRGSRNAWKIALLISFVSAIGHILKAIDYEEAGFSLFVFLSLLYTRRSYIRKHDIDFQLRSLQRTSLLIAILLIYGIGGFYFLEKIHFGKDLSFFESVKMFIQTFAGENDIHPLTKFGREFIFTVRFAGSVIVLYMLWFFMAARKVNKNQLEEDIKLAKEIVAESGNSRLDYFKVYFDKLLFFNDSRTAFLSYKVANGYAVVMENPVSKVIYEREKLIKSFKKYCQENGLGLLFYRIPEESIELYRKSGFKTVLIGQEATVNLENFSLSGGSKSSLRNALNKIKKSGFITRTYSPPLKAGLIQQLKDVSNEWLSEHKMSEVAFTQGVFDKNELKNSHIITLENEEEEILAFVNLIPDYNEEEGTYDLIRKASGAPNGAIDYLMIEVFEHFRQKAYTRVNLGMAALSGFEKGKSLKQRTVYYITEIIKNNSRFKGLHAFKEKFDPEWTNSYLAYQSLYDLIRFPVVLNKVSKL
jgi:phosphatidylglycerol lysyltransferase